MISQCDNCESTLTSDCAGMYAPHHDAACGEHVRHYLGESPRDFPNASKGDPADLCGVCYRLLRGHRVPDLEARAGW